MTGTAHSRLAAPALAAALVVAGCGGRLAGPVEVPRPADVDFRVIEKGDRDATLAAAAEPAPQPPATAVSVAPPPVRAPDADPGGDLRDRAVDRLVAALDDPAPLLRANAIEGLHPSADYAAIAARRGLDDPNRGVRFVAAMTVGTLGLESMGPRLEPLLRDPSSSVRAAAIFGLRRTGHAANPTPLSTMLAGGDPEVKANAALVLGELGDPSAVPMLEAAIGRNMERVSVEHARIVDMQIAEALVKLGAERHLEGIRAALFAPADQGELTALACQISGRLRDERVVPTLMNLAHRPGPARAPAEIRLAAVTALADIDPSRVTAEVPLEYAGHERSALRAQAALALGAVGGQRARSALGRLLEDPDPLVQVSAAAAILQLDG